eukprot:6195022-Pleurochrysis_carterae.AAC.2
MGHTPGRASMQSRQTRTRRTTELPHSVSVFNYVRSPISHSPAPEPCVANCRRKTARQPMQGRTPAHASIHASHS